MRNGTHSRSVAAELALLSLNELEPRIADDPELLISTETVLCFAAIRHSDPVQGEHWRSILEKYDKSSFDRTHARRAEAYRRFRVQVGGGPGLAVENGSDDQSGGGCGA